MNDDAVVIAIGGPSPSIVLSDFILSACPISAITAMPMMPSQQTLRSSLRQIGCCRRKILQSKTIMLKNRAGQSENPPGRGERKFLIPAPTLLRFIGQTLDE